MIREETKDIDGRTVVTLRPENADDEREIERMAKAGEIEAGDSFADQQPETEQDLIDGGVLEPDE